ncbi:prephenate dehydratase [Gilvimarinus sp. DA14]|uniref:prephenate dehydratase n=1 Tax=Gilvimarinus sp. DA14 TaxID=2956798 RepID=UPI0020B7E4D9|nr:prephenate dehydratase [Gilvimarinus sp. DA14]UTF60761.1 prephenate dehydratase [Gilvimarinus sp. DA14]
MSDKTQDALLALRDRIDTIDADIGKLISERARCAQEVAEVKSASGSGDVLYYRPEREAQVLRKAMERNEGPLSNEEMARLFREIMSACLALEQPIKVAYLGPEGTFTQQAALKHFGQSAVALPFSAIDEVFREVEAGAVNYGVVPVENSTEGVVSHTLDNFMGSNLKICGEVELRVHHNLVVSSVTNVNSISRIYSHGQSLAQCRKWLDSHYPKAERIAVSSNAEAARRLKGEWNAAAIAPAKAAEIYELNILAEKIEDQPDNSTRFLIIGTEQVQASGHDKTSLLVAMRNQPGALHNLLEPFHRNKIDLTRVETRPSRTGVWTYVFFVDFTGHVDEPIVRETLDEVASRVADLKILGSYPKAVL